MLTYIFDPTLSKFLNTSFKTKKDARAYLKNHGYNKICRNYMTSETWIFGSSVMELRSEGPKRLFKTKESKVLKKYKNHVKILKKENNDNKNRMSKLR